MSELRPEKQTDCQQWNPNEESPDGLRGTPAERFLQAAQRVFAADRDMVLQAEKDAQEKRETTRKKPGKPARPRTA